MLRKRRVHTQQNLVTALCLACMVFAAFWSFHAAAMESRKAKTASADKENNSKPSQEIGTAVQTELSSGNDIIFESVSDTLSSMPLAENSEADMSSTAETPHMYATPTDTADDLSDAVFIGDSRVVGMMNSTDKPQADFICAVGLNIDTVLTSYDIAQGDGTTGTLQQALAKRQYGRVYISFGTNEMGWPYIDSFKEHYTDMVKTIQTYQPNAKIILVGILPVTASKDMEGDSVNNANATLFTAAIQEVANEQGMTYLDCSPAVADENGYLPEEASTDGVHMTSEYCLYWQNYIIDNS